MKAALPPGPTEPRLAQMMQWISRPMAFATRQRDRYGDAFTANIDGDPWVMLGDPDDVRIVLPVDQREYVHGRLLTSSSMRVVYFSNSSVSAEN